MFRFSLNIGDAKTFSDALLNEMDMTRDETFKKEIWKEFLTRHQGFDPQDPESDGFEEGQLIGGSLCFRMEKEYPETVKDAVRLVKDKLFFSPNHIWLNNQQYLIKKSHHKKKGVYPRVQNRH